MIGGKVSNGLYPHIAFENVIALIHTYLIVTDTYLSYKRLFFSSIILRTLFKCLLNNQIKELYNLRCVCSCYNRY